MAKKGKITVFASDYPNVVKLAELMGMELKATSQIGIEINIEILYRDLTQLGKLMYNVGLAKVSPSTIPQTDSAVKSTGKKKTN